MPFLLGNILHRMPLIVCILRCYKVLLPSLSSSAQAQRITQTSKVEMAPKTSE